MPAHVPGADALGRNEIGRGRVTLGDLLANDGGAAHFVSVDATSAHGAKVSLVNGVIIYEPQSDIPGGDSFTYTIRNADGGLVIVPVQVAGMPADDYRVKDNRNRSRGEQCHSRAFHRRAAPRVSRAIYRHARKPAIPAGFRHDQGEG